MTPTEAALTARVEALEEMLPNLVDNINAMRADLAAVPKPAAVPGAAKVPAATPAKPPAPVAPTGSAKA